MSLFRRRRAAGDDNPYEGLRAMVLGLDPAAAGLPEGGAAYGALLETTFDNGRSFTLVCLADGTTSLYTSTGGGVIGAGAHDVVAAATLRLLDVVAGSLHLFEPDADDAVPPPGHAVLRALTPAGRRRVLAPEADLGEGRHPASPVFRAAHEVITQVRLTEEARG